MGVNPKKADESVAKSVSRTAIVQSVCEITPNMRRIVFGGPELADFPAGKEGGYIKLIFPDLPRANPKRPVMRTYSIRAHDKAAGQIVVDFALHNDTGGIAIEWALQAKPGDEMLISGPGTIKMVPPDADWYLIAADMTGLPAALCNLERLPDGAKGHVVFEIASEADQLDLALPQGMDLQWVVNPHPDRSKTQLFDAIKAAEWHGGVPFVWSACEFDTMRSLRSYYRTERAVLKQNLYLSSYWCAGRTEDQHKIDKNKDAKADAPSLKSLISKLLHRAGL